MTFKWFALPLLGVILLGGCGGSEEEARDSLRRSPPADLILIGENILTVDPATQGATAVAVRDGRIVKVTNQADILALRGDNTRVLILGEHTLVPGFIDSHGHVGASARISELVNLSSPPVGSAENIDDVIALLRAHIDAKQPAEGEWVVGYGYDDSLLAENRHPNRDDLDRASTEHPIFLMHVSGHLGAVNSAGLAAADIHADTVGSAGRGHPPTPRQQRTQRRPRRDGVFAIDDGAAWRDRAGPVRNDVSRNPIGLRGLRDYHGPRRRDLAGRYIHAAHGGVRVAVSH